MPAPAPAPEPAPAVLPRAAGPVVLRRLSPHDLRAFQSYRNDPVVGRYQGWQAMSDAQALDFLNDVATQPLLQPGHWTQIAIADADMNALHGDIGLHVAADGAQAEISASRSHRGRKGAAWPRPPCAARLICCSSTRRRRGSSPSPTRATRRRCGCSNVWA